MTDETDNSTATPATPPISSGEEELIRAVVPVEAVGTRLDRFLADLLPDHTRSRLKDLIKAGQVMRGDNVILSPNARVKEGDVYDLRLPPAASPVPLAENIPLNVIYEDDDLIVIDKPAGMVVHPATGHWRGTLVNALLYHCGESLSGIGGVKRPGIVHRLDKQTSGLMVVAKNDKAHLGLSKQFADHCRKGPLTRAYTAFVWGVLIPPPDWMLT
jgi:23S rRNA pseudouridine1911/1915/1917 synthase